MKLNETTKKEILEEIDLWLKVNGIHDYILCNLINNIGLIDGVPKTFKNVLGTIINLIHERWFGADEISRFKIFQD